MAQEPLSRVLTSSVRVKNSHTLFNLFNRAPAYRHVNGLTRQGVRIWSAIAQPTTFLMQQSRRSQDR